MKENKSAVVRIVKSAMGLLAVATIVSVLTVGVSSAATTVGKVTFVGTLGEESSGTSSAHMRVRVHGTCAAQPPSDKDAPGDRWIEIQSARTDGNGVNMRNAYSTLLSALLSGKNVQIDGLPDCSTTEGIVMNLSTGNVAIF
jgi:hypothetical protein